ncbi:hypothetical protein [Cryptosporangium aurantiacum]|uniref:Uncharacterized protein n=1 Tax=Cryptosporangium aurantiacum TaxID=134849 RepID=A0A1M7PRW2_9ACTN|nr:hypothetical protein [Cryptosporangium aurantiacum]SHN20005.1 hypothetical protein SAMN05443668_103614 [Cryptosporangium aurantiacum]
MLDSVTEESLARELGWYVIDSICPEEKDWFAELSDSYFADPRSALSPRRSTEDLAFGGADFDTWTPAALAVGAYVANLLGTLTTDSLREQLRAPVGDLVRRMFRRRTRPEDAVVLSPAQITTVHDAALRHGQSVGLSHPQATTVADAIVGELYQSG